MSHPGMSDPYADDSDPYADDPTTFTDATARHFPDGATAPVYLQADVPPPPLEEPRRSFPHRHRTLIMVGAAVVVLGILGGIGWAMFGPHQGTQQGTHQSPPAPLAQHQGAGGSVRGTVTSESGTTWTLRAKSGETITVNVTSGTKFRAHKGAVSATSIPVGATVVVTGTRDNGTMTATRITEADAASPSPTG